MLQKIIPLNVDMQQKQIGVTKVIFSILALALLTSLFFKAWLDMDANYDVGWYHLPFAARIWRIIPAEFFTSGSKVEARYDGFPLLAHFFQGMLWKITGRVQAANLVGYLSLIVYFFFLNKLFKIPLYLSTVAILTIPAVLTHAPTGFVDLPGNIGTSILVMMTFIFFSESRLPEKKELLITVLSAAMAVNTKPQLQPLVFIIYWILGARICWLYFKYTVTYKRNLWIAAFFTIICSICIFFTPIKNTIVYQNPFYPTKVSIAGVVLNHKAVPLTYKEGNRPQKWLRSIFEINTPEWSADQFNRNHNPKLLGRAGGFFGAYVIFNLLLLFCFNVVSYRNKIIRKISLVSLIIMFGSSIFVANFPQSHELRYFMFWMIVLVSLNLNILVNFNKNILSRIHFVYYIYLCFFVIVIIKIESFYLKPDFRSLDKYLEQIVKIEYLNQISPNNSNCLIARYQSDNSVAIQHAFFYSSYFHSPHLPYYLYIKDNPSKCKDRIVPSQPSTTKIQ